MKYRKKPIVIEAIQWNGKNFEEIVSQFGAKDNIVRHFMINNALEIITLEGNMIANKGDYIIKGVNGEVYPCKPDIFEKTYEELKNE